MFTDTDIERAVDWLRDNSVEAAKAKAERIYCEEFRKSLKAILASESNESSEAARDRHAYSHSRYQEHLYKLKDAVLKDETMRALRVAAEMKIEVWRTQAANQRSIKL